MTKITIIRVSGNELANQLWNYISIYAYTLERGFGLKNPSFFEYGEYFTMSPAHNLLCKIIFFLPFRNYVKRKTALQRKIWRKLYTWYSGTVLRKHTAQVVSSNNASLEPYYLPPSSKPQKRLTELELGHGSLYFDGWLFRNPTGIEKYRKEIREYFQPRQDIKKSVEGQIKDLRSRFKKIIGVHIRQGDYKNWRNGTYFIPQTRVRESLDEYSKIKGLNNSEACFVITSDEKIETDLFTGLNIFISEGNAVHDIFLLSKTDVVIGSNSTFGAFASYYGNIPFIVMQKERMDWNYYKDKKTFFENKYSSFVYY